MTDAVVQVPPIPGTTGQPNQQIDTSAITRSDGTVVERQRIIIAGDADAAGLVRVGRGSPNPGDWAITTRLAYDSPDLADIKDLLSQLLQATQDSFAMTTAWRPFVDRGKMRTTSYPPLASPRNISGTIVTGGTAQVLFQAANVRGFDLQNQSSASQLGFSWWTSTPAIGASGTYALNPGTPGGYYSTPPTLGMFDLIAVYVVGPTTAQAFTGSYW
jgi:hypothetical protein